jgi:hypothetical protein
VTRLLQTKPSLPLLLLSLSLLFLNMWRLLCGVKWDKVDKVKLGLGPWSGSVVVGGWLDETPRVCLQNKKTGLYQPVSLLAPRGPCRVGSGKRPNWVRVSSLLQMD